MFVHSVLLLGLTIGTSPNLCAEAEVFAATPAMHLRPTYLPISRVIENMQAGLAERPGDRRLYMNIARAHSYAFQVADEGKPVNWRAVVRMTPKAYEDSGEGSRGHDAPKDEGDREVTYLTMSERLHHLSASIAAFSSASRLPGPAKLTRSGSIPAARTISSSPPDAMSNPSTSPVMCSITGAKGLAFTA